MGGRFVEHDFLRWLRTLEADPRLAVPIGDDAAVFAGAEGQRLVLACDAVVEGRHAEPGDVVALARKVVRCNLSDLAAMGATPDVFLLTLALARGADAALARRVIELVAEECRRHGVAFAGGDTVVGDGGMLLSGCVIGHLVGPAIRRGGARPGDLVVVTGSLGGSLLGRHRDFEPRLEEARHLVRHGPPSAMTDVSDGLSRDLANIAIASAVDAVLVAEAIPLAPAATTAAARDGRSALRHALEDGEDFELIATLTPVAWERVRKEWTSATPLTVIGRIEEGSGLLALETAGLRAPLEARGFDHGA